MPTTPPLDNKQEHTSYAADATWGDSCEPYYPNGEEAGAALRRLIGKLSALKKEPESYEKRVNVFNEFYDYLCNHPELIRISDLDEIKENFKDIDLFSR